MAIKTIDVPELARETSNLYEAVVIMSKRARQLSTHQKAELDEKLRYFEGFETDLDDARMSEEQARISVDFEKRPKPPELAINEMFSDEIYFRRLGEDL